MHESFAAAEGTDRATLPAPARASSAAADMSIKMSFLTYNSSGHETLDMPQITSIYGSSMIEAMWYPHHYTALVQGVQSGHIEAGFIGAEHLVQEFSPELKRFFHLRW